MKRFLVTGSTSGIGSSVFDELDVADAFGGIGQVRRARAMTRIDCDFNDAEAVTRWIVEAADNFGALDGVFHAAGVAQVVPLRMTTAAIWNAAMMAATSAIGILRAVAIKGVMKDGGSVVLMSSVAAHSGTPGMVAYSAGKGAIEAMARAAAVELAPRGIRVNCIAAGAVRTPMHERITSRMTQGARDAYVGAHPLGFGSVEAVRDTALHLLSDSSRWTTGTTVVVDGGYLAK